MNKPNNGDKTTCEGCGEPIEYYFGWRHADFEGRGHAARPRPVDAAAEPVWPVLVDDSLVLLLDSEKGARLEAV